MEEHKMKIAFLVVTLGFLVAGLISGLSARRYLTENGKTLAWYRRLAPFWANNTAYTPKGQTLVRMSSILIPLGALLYLVTRLV
jgi:hypothetical protein